jgi:hypothetical protein
MIIGLSGRKGCGKTELASICVEKGFKKLSFADALKDLACGLLQISREELQRTKEISRPYVCDLDAIRAISKETGIPQDDLEALLGRAFETPRELLQYLGTEVIRTYAPEWHIQKLAGRMQDGCNYCIDDCRFPNEKAFLESKDAYLAYIIRPANFDVSNHESEVALKPCDFEEIIVNNYKLGTLRNKWSRFVDTLLNPEFVQARDPIRLRFANKLVFRKWLKEGLKSRSSVELAAEVGMSRDAIVWWCNSFMLRIERKQYRHDEEAFSVASERFAYVCGLLTSDGCMKLSPSRRNVCVSFSSCDRELAEEVQKTFGTNRPIDVRIHAISGKEIYTIDCQNYRIIENLKHWNLKPRKSTREQVPDIIRSNVDAQKCWIVGMIDGDGSVFVSSAGHLTIFVLGSRETMDYIAQICPYESSVRQHKNTKLYQIRWQDYCALDVAAWLEPAVSRFGLRRKWNALEKYRNSPRRRGRLRMSCLKDATRHRHADGRYRQTYRVTYEDLRPAEEVFDMQAFCTERGIKKESFRAAQRAGRYFHGMTYEVIG